VSTEEGPDGDIGVCSIEMSAVDVRSARERGGDEARDSGGICVSSSIRGDAIEELGIDNNALALGTGKTVGEQVVGAGINGDNDIQGEDDVCDTAGAEPMVIGDAEGEDDPGPGTKMVCSQRSKSESAN
jgi:hypothetical protein